MAKITKGKSFSNGELVTPALIHQLVDEATISGIVNADISASAAIVDTKLAQISTANKVAQSAVTNLTTDLAGKAPTSHTHTIADVTNLQTTLNGKQASGSYAPATGIAQSAVTNLTTDLAGKASSSHTHDDRYYTETEIDNKLSGLPVSGHTHTIANVTGLQTALDGKQASGSYAPSTGIAPSAITGTAVITTDSRLSDARTPVMHTHDDRYYTETEIDTKLSGLPVGGHTHDDRYYTETEMNTLLAGKQASGSYAPATGIAQSAVTNLTTDLAGKAPTSHTHTIANVTNLQTALDGKQASGSYAAATHTHAISDTTGLQTALDGKAASSHTHTIANVTNLQTALDGKQASGSYAPATGIAPSAITGTAVIATDSRLSDARTPLDASVTNAKLALATQQFLVPTGAIMPFAMNSAPTGWLAANGNEYSKTGSYAALFTAIGTTYGETNGSGGTGTTHFRVPDLCGYFVRGFGTNRDGTASDPIFGAKQADAVGPHTHGYDDYYQASSLSKTNDNDRTDAVSIRMVNVEIVETGANLDRTTKSQSPASTTETRPDNIAMLYCIKF